MLVFILIAIAAAFLFYYFLVKPHNYWKERGVTQGNPKWIFGDNYGPLARTQSFADMLEMVYNQSSGVRYTGMYQMLLPTLILKDPELIKQITVKDFEHFTDHWTFIPESADPLWANNLFNLTGKKWRDTRTILSPSFTSSKMRNMFHLIEECAKNFVKHFQDKNQDVVTVEFKDIFTRFTNDVIATTAFGIKVDSLAEPRNYFYLMGKELTNLGRFINILKFTGYLLFPKLSQMLKVKLFSTEVTEYFPEIVKNTIKMREEKSIVRPDMIHLLMEARKGNQKQEEKDIIDTGFSTARESNLDKIYASGKSKAPKELTDIDIAAQAMVFFFAGFESVAGLMSFLSYELAINPDIQDRLRHEVQSTSDECEGKLTYEGLLKMKYLDMVVSETLRKWPNIASVDRVCTKPYTIEPVTPDEKPVHLNKGAVLWLPIYAMHRDAKYFPDPERFDPERFSEENKDKIKPYTYFPFGLGPRNCIASRLALLETKAMIFQILSNFEIVPVKESQIPVQLSKKQFNLSAEEGFWFGLKRIKA